MHTFIIYTCSIVLFFWCSLAFTSEKDWLSGDYTVVLTEDQKEEYLLEYKELPVISVIKEGEGWVVRQNGESLKLSHPSTEPGFYSELFPKNKQGSDTQCGISGIVIFCHVPSQIMLEGTEINTGYFIIRRSFGLIELIKLK